MWDDALIPLLSLLANSDAGRAQIAQPIPHLSRSVDLYWVPLKWATGAAVALAVLAALSLLWRAARRRWPSVFISFQHAREGLAVAVADALTLQGFRVRRVPLQT